VLDARLRPLVDPVLERLAAGLDRRGVTADRVTVAGFLVGVAAIGAVALGAHGSGLALFLVNRLGDGLDGALARRHRITDLGGFLDIVLDFLIYAGLVFAFALANPAANALAAAFLLFAFMGTGSSFLAFAVMAARRGLESDRHGPKSLYYLGGLTEGTETILFFVLALLLPGSFPLLAVVFGAMCWITTGARIATAWSLLRRGRPPRACRGRRDRS